LNGTFGIDPVYRRIFIRPCACSPLLWQALDKTDDVVAQNLHQMQQEVKKTEEHLKRGWSGTFTSCIMIVFVLGMFLMTFLFMRLFPKRRLLLWV
jgi:hypothetical protein